MLLDIVLVKLDERRQKPALALASAICARERFRYHKYDFFSNMFNDQTKDILR
jgi:hypothetical protein